MLEYRIHWNASSNISFSGRTDWQEWNEEDVTANDVEDELYIGAVDCIGLSEALDASGFNWWVEVRNA